MQRTRGSWLWLKVGDQVRQYSQEFELDFQCHGGTLEGFLQESHHLTSALARALWLWVENGLEGEKQKTETSEKTAEAAR